MEGMYLTMLIAIGVFSLAVISGFINLLIHDARKARKEKGD